LKEQGIHFAMSALFFGWTMNEQKCVKAPEQASRIFEIRFFHVFLAPAPENGGEREVFWAGSFKWQWVRRSR
jgi:hypothetical protein